MYLSFNVSRYLQCAPYAPRATAEAPERPANLTNGLPCRTNLSNPGMFSPEGKIIDE